MIRTLILTLLCATPALAQTTHSPTDLDSNRDGKVVLSKPRDAFKARDVLVLCPDAPAYTYAITCPAAGIAAPRITMPFEPGKPTAKAPRRADLHIGRVLDGYVLDGTADIHDARIDLARYGITMRRKDGSYGTVAGLTVRRVDITAGEAPIAIRGGSSDILIEDARLTCTGTSGGIPGGIKIGAANSPANHHIVITRFAIKGCASADRKGYVQGDGIPTERPDHHIAITHGTIDATGADSGLDIKSSDTTIDDVAIIGGSYSARLRSTGEVGTLMIDSPRKAAIQIDSTTRRTIRHLILTGSLPAEADIVTNGAGGTLTIERCSRPVTTRVAKGTALVLGAGCVK